MQNCIRNQELGLVRVPVFLHSKFPNFRSPSGDQAVLGVQSIQTPKCRYFWFWRPKNLEKGLNLARPDFGLIRKQADKEYYYYHQDQDRSCLRLGALSVNEMQPHARTHLSQIFLFWPSCLQPQPRISSKYMCSVTHDIHRLQDKQTVLLNLFCFLLLPQWCPSNPSSDRDFNC